MTSEVYLVDGVRTPQGKYGGALAGVRPDDLAALVVREVLRRSGAPADAVEEVVLGAANQSGEDNRDVARMAVLLAGPAGRDVGDFATAMGSVPWIDLKRPRFGKEEPAPIERPAEAFMAADVIVLADLSPASLNDAAWAALGRAVRGGGRTLLVLAGNGDWLADPDIGEALRASLP